MDAVDVVGPGPEPVFGASVLIEIEAWGANLHIGLASELTPQVYSFQGGLNYVRGFDIEGRVITPGPHQAKTIRLHLAPFGSNVRFGPDQLDEVGQLNVHAPRSQKPHFSGTLLVPEGALPMVATCLSSVWRFVHIWMFDEEPERASISAYSFSSTVHENRHAPATAD